MTAPTHPPEPHIAPPRFRWLARVALPAVLAIAFGALFAGSLSQRFAPTVDVEATPVVQRPAIARTVSAEATREAEAVVQAAGWIEPDPFPTRAVTLTNGIVEEVHFLEGTAVAQGEVLFRLVDDDARLEHARARAELRAAEENWEANIEAARAAAVAAAEVAETRARLEQARAALVREQALLADARSILRRIELLLEDEVRTEQEYDSAKAAADAQAARVEVARAHIDELVATLARREAERDAAQERLALRTEERQRLDLARVAAAEAELRMERMDVRAPIDGVVMERLVEPGSMMMAFSENAEMATAAKLYDPARLQVGVDVPLADAAKVGRGQRALVVVEVLPEQVFAGQVTRVTNLADIQKNTLEVKVALDDPSPLLKPDMLARVRFLAAANNDDADEPAVGLSVFAPAGAVDNGAAWVVAGYDGETGTAQRRSVRTTGAEEAGWVEIETGLQPGDLVVTAGDAALQAGQRVRVTQTEGN